MEVLLGLARADARRWQAQDTTTVELQSYKIHTAAAPAEDWIWGAADIKGARGRTRRTGVYALLDWLSLVTRLS